MSQDLLIIRRSLSKISTDLKQGQLISAATAVRDGARLFGRTPMIKNEAEELSSLLQAACDLLRYNREIAKIFPLSITYAQGREADLADLMNQLIEALQQSSTEDAIQKHAAYKNAEVARGRKLLSEGNLREARRTFQQLTEEYANDATLAGEVGELFLLTGQLDDAYRYVAAAVKMEPDSPHLLNKLGIILRKMKNFSQAISVYRRAIEVEPGDANLHFNLGRVYLDQQNWPGAIECAEKALDISPVFTEAAKLAAYAQRKLAG